MKSKFDLTGKIAVVTGANGKLGPTWIRALLNHGASVFPLDMPGLEPSEDFIKLQKEFGGERLSTLFGANSLDKEALTKALEKCIDVFGVPDILVNNAGIDQPPAPGKSFAIEDIPREMFSKTIEVNVYGAFLVTQVFAKPMIEKGSGSVINIGSLYASVSPNETVYDHIKMDPPFIKPPAYGASKAALLNLTKYLAAHWGPKGVRVNALSPGGVLGEQDDEFKRKFNSRVPLGRMAELDDLEGPLVFLASDASSYVTGINLPVEGGFLVW